MNIHCDPSLHSIVSWVSIRSQVVHEMRRLMDVCPSDLMQRVQLPVFAGIKMSELDAVIKGAQQMRERQRGSRVIWSHHHLEITIRQDLSGFGSSGFVRIRQDSSHRRAIDTCVTGREAA